MRLIMNYPSKVSSEWRQSEFDQPALQFAIQLEVASPERIVLDHRSSHADGSGVIATMPVRKKPTTAAQRNKQPRPVVITDSVMDCNTTHHYRPAPQRPILHS